MRKGLVTAVAVVVALPAWAGTPDLKLCDRLQSTLCTPLTMAFGFEEAGDGPRYDSASGIVALEPDGHDVARAAGKIGSYAVDFSGNENSHLRVPGLATLGPGFWTLVAWVYPDALGSAGQVQTILANDYKGQGGTHVYLENVSGSLKLRVSVTNRETNAVITATSGTNLAIGAWNFIAVGASQWPTQYGQANIFAQVGNSTKGTAALTYSVRAANYETYLGARVMQPAGYRTPFDGRLDALYVFGSALNAAQLTNLHGSTSGKVYPFVD